MGFVKVLSESEKSEVASGSKDCKRSSRVKACFVGVLVALGGDVDEKEREIDG